MAAEKPKFDARLKDGVGYFEQMLKVMPDDRTTLEFLAVAYLQLGENAKAEHALAELARVLLKEGDFESAKALLGRLEACEDPAAKAMAIRVTAMSAPHPELVPETPLAGPVMSPGFRNACESESKLATKLGEKEVAEHLMNIPDNGAMLLISALATLEKEKPEAYEASIAALADEFGDVPVPLEAFDIARDLVGKMPEELIKRRGVIPFAQLGDTALVVTLSPHDRELKRQVGEALGMKCRFYLSDPKMVEAAILKIYPESAAGN